ncbi:unnamed protein product [Commensalibacter communis]|nr:unnamed protein product [Commensalibacter communis]CAI3950055.1 unnamed protein product [Commensalibacter communis]
MYLELSLCINTRCLLIVTNSIVIQRTTPTLFVFSHSYPHKKTAIANETTVVNF